MIGAALEVHRRLGPGFLERVYEGALCIELRRNGVPHTRQPSLQVLYRDEVVGDYVADLVADGKIICELKATDDLNVTSSFF